jgi:hypothetical protein
VTRRYVGRWVATDILRDIERKISAFGGIMGFEHHNTDITVTVHVEASAEASFLRALEAFLDEQGIARPKRP